MGHNFVPVHLIAQTTITVPANQNTSMAFPCTFVHTDKQTPIAMGYVTGAVGSDQSATSITQLNFTTKISDIVPSIDSGNQSCQVIPGPGSVSVESIKSSQLDMDPSWLYLTPGTTHAFAQAQLYGNHPAGTQPAMCLNQCSYQTHYGSYVLNSLGNELPMARTPGPKFYGMLPQFVDARGNTAPYWMQDPVQALGATGLKWGQDPGFVINNGSGNVTVPVLSVTNQSANQIKLVVTVRRQYFVIPNEMYMAHSTMSANQEVQWRFPPQIIQLASQGATGNTIKEAQMTAIDNARYAHPAHQIEDHERQVSIIKAASTNSATGQAARASEPSTTSQIFSGLAKAVGLAADAYTAYKRAQRPQLTAFGRYEDAVASTYPRVEEVD